MHCEIEDTKEMEKLPPFLINFSCILGPVRSNIKEEITWYQVTIMFMQMLVYLFCFIFGRNVDTWT